MRLRSRFFAVIATLAVLASGCGSTSVDTKAASGDATDSKVLRVLAGSEVKDLEPMLPAIKKATGITLKPTYAGTLDGASRVHDGEDTDAAWFSSSRYLDLLDNGKSRVLDRQKIMLSPVVMGVKASIADKFGWTNNPNVTWKDIADKTSAGQLHFAMTNPTASNSGFTALLGVASALSPSGDALDSGNIDTAALTNFFKGQSLTAGSSGFLSDSYVRGQASLDGMINYESVLLSLNQGGKLQDPLTLIYPKEGISTADYPLLLVNGAKRDAYNKVVAYLKAPAAQNDIMTTTFRRPVNSSVTLAPVFGTRLMVELPFPSKLETVNKLLFSYLDDISPPSHTVFLVDTSGSMAGDRITQLKQALNNLTGQDDSVTGQFARFRNREEVSIIPFSSTVGANQSFTIGGTDPNDASRVAIRTFVNGLDAVGGTAIFSGLDSAYRTAQTIVAKEPDRFVSIVLMTDGENNEGIGEPAFEADFAAYGEAAKKVKTFPILFGEASPSQLQAVATLTGGTVFDSRKTSLTDIFKQIRGYQ